MAVFQVIFKSKINFEEKIKELLIESVATRLDESEIRESFNDIFTYKYAKKLKNKKYLVGFELDLSEFYQEDQSPNFVYKNLFSVGDEIENIFIYKEMETVLLGELNLIEQALREVLSYIFVQQYPTSIYDLLKEIDIAPIKDAPKAEKRFVDLEENQFFYLLFTHYIKLTDLKTLGEKDLMRYVQDSDDYIELRNNLLNRGITNPKYRDFILSLREIMQPIEDMRNCIAHNRSFDEDAYENFLRAKDSFGDKVQEFWSAENLKN